MSEPAHSEKGRVYVLKCTACGDTVGFEQQEANQSLYGIAYVAGARHEGAYRSPQCATNAARYLTLLEIRPAIKETDDIGTGSAI